LLCACVLSGGLRRAGLRRASTAHPGRRTSSDYGWEQLSAREARHRHRSAGQGLRPRTKAW